MRHCPGFVPSAPTRAFALLVFSCSLLLAPCSRAADGAATAKPFNIPAGKAEKTLKTFSTQAGVELVYATDQVQGIKTNAVKGDFLPAAALTQLVEGTPLLVVTDEKPGAFAIRREGPAVPNAPRAAQNDSSDRPSASRGIRSEDGTLRLDKFEVMESKLLNMPRTDFRATANRIPSGIGPFDF